MDQELQIRVRLFAGPRAAAGRGEVELRLATPVRVGDLRRALAAAVPALAPWALAPIAVNAAYAHDEVEVGAGADVALIPPVSGGQAEPPRVTLTTGPIDIAQVTERVRSPRSGAVVTFVGTVRNETGGRETAFLEYEAFGEMAQREIGAILSQAEDRWGLDDAVVVHRLGRLELGEVSIAIAVAAPHRAAAFAACTFIMDEIKKTAPVWKCEHWADGSHEWVHPTAEEH